MPKKKNKNKRKIKFQSYTELGLCDVCDYDMAEWVQSVIDTSISNGAPHLGAFGPLGVQGTPMCCTKKMRKMADSYEVRKIISTGIEDAWTRHREKEGEK
jgi:hypothetical protein